MSVRKIILNNGEIKWDVRMYEDGRGSRRLSRRFDRRSDAEDYYNKTKEDLRQRKLNPFGHITFAGRTFESEAIAWFEDGKNRFSASHLKRLEGVFKEIFPLFGQMPIEKMVPEVLTQLQQNQKRRGAANATDG